ncbi:MAG: alpha/beta hydrolase domain-containing protein, partial [Chloroflexota bacterium]
VMPHVAGGMRGEFNQRFGQPSKDLPSVIPQFLPSTALPSTDPVTETTGGLLERMDARRSPVKVFFTNTGAEYWRGDASLIHTDPSGTQEIPEHPSTRAYSFASAMHGPGSWPPTDTLATEGLRGQHLMNTVDYRPLLRALLAALDDWVSEDREPPESSHPRLSDGTAVPPHSLESAFRGIPGLTFPPHIPIPRRLDFGLAADVEQATKLPPEAGEQVGSLVSDVDEDGNETGGIRHPDVREPLGTHMPWNLRHPEIGVPEQLTGLTGGLRGSTVPLPATRAERERRGDPRRSIEERYASRDEYLSRVREAANAMVNERTMLQEDVERVVSAAAERWDAFAGS